jgi:hypothetical protein
VVVLLFSAARRQNESQIFSCGFVQIRVDSCFSSFSGPTHARL